jgi:uncharacterized membrane protein YdjX (TVP38/TMEM64 family)
MTKRLSSFLNKKNFFYLFIIANIALLIYIYLKGSFINFEVLKDFLSKQHFVISYSIYILILIVRGLTLLPGTAFLLAGIYLFTFSQVYIAIQIAIFCYCLIIYNFSHKLNFKIPQKILDYEQKIKSKEILIIFSLCFIPGISINILVYFLSTINISLKNILIGVLSGTMITSVIYISIIKGFILSYTFVNL